MSALRPAQASSDSDRERAKGLAARAFDRAVRATGYTNESVGALLGVSDTRVRRMRSDDPGDLDVVPSIADVLLADHTLGERLLQELRAERLAIHGAPPAVTAEQKLHRAMGASARFVSTVSAALEDGVLEQHELPAVQEAQRGLGAEMDQLAALLALSDRRRA